MNHLRLIHAIVLSLTVWPTLSLEGQAQEADRNAFPAMMVTWQSDAARMESGVQKADALREKLLENPNGRDILAEYCRHMTEFQNQLVARGTLGESVGRFRLDCQTIREQLQGKAKLNPRNTFAAFDGKWFGYWDVWPMNHYWRPSDVFTPNRAVDGSKHTLRALQYAWIGNGFGWNYVVQLEGDVERECVLGMVYYLDGHPYDKVVDEKPHVGYSDGDERLVWFTAKEVFFEERQPATAAQPERYCITALYHNLLDENPGVSPDGVQAVYTRDAMNRPAFQKFQWQPGAMDP